MKKKIKRKKELLKMKRIMFVKFQVIYAKIIPWICVEEVR